MCQKYYKVNLCSIHNKHNISNNNIITMTWYSMSSCIKLTPLKCHKLILKCPMDRQMSHNRTRANWVPLIYLSSCFIFHLFSSSFQRAIWTKNEIDLETFIKQLSCLWGWLLDDIKGWTTSSELEPFEIKSWWTF
jgi:hypothetical protein